MFWFLLPVELAKKEINAAIKTSQHVDKVKVGHTALISKFLSREKNVYTRLHQLPPHPRAVKANLSKG